MLKFIDSHCHLNMLDYQALSLNMDEVIVKAKEQGVDTILCIATDLDNSQEVIDIAQRYPNVYATAGVHPSEDVTGFDSDRLVSFFENKKVVAVGETGLDYHYNDSGLDKMRDCFAQQIAVAREVKRPLVIHSRAASDDTKAILKAEGADQVGGVMHCFTESYDLAKYALDLGFYISFSGIITFKNAQNVRDVAKKIPLERILIETDAPYLTPHPWRGKPNQPAYVIKVAEMLAEVKDISLIKVAQATTSNFFNCFMSQPK